MTVNILTHKKKLKPQRNQTYIQVNVANIRKDNNNSNKSSLKILGEKKSMRVFFIHKTEKTFYSMMLKAVAGQKSVNILLADASQMRLNKHTHSY